MDFPAFNIVVNNAWHVYSYVLKNAINYKNKTQKRQRYHNPNILIFIKSKDY